MTSKQSFLLCLISIALLLGCTVDFVLRDAGTDGASDSDSDTDSDVEPCWDEGTRYQDSCYLYVPDTATFFDAETSCVEWGGHLVSIGSPQENAYVQAIISDAVWIGLHKGSTVSTGIPIPNNNTCDAIVNSIDPGGGHYTGDTSDPYSDNDVDRYSCEASAAGNDMFLPMQLSEAGWWMFALNPSDLGPGYDNPVLALYNDTGDRSSENGCVGSTESFCLSDGTYSRYLYLDTGDYILMVDGDYTSHEGTFSFDVYQFVFTDATPLSYENWSAGEPDRAAENENCVRMTQAAQGTWSDKPCSGSYGYVCKRPL